MAKRSSAIGRASHGVLFIALWGALAPACGSEEGLGVGAPCSASSTCSPGLICVFGRCHSQCKTTSSCPSGERCIDSDVATVCQLLSESGCSASGQCPAPLICASDDQCRNECTSKSSCLAEQECSVDGACAEPRELDSSGKLKQSPRGGTTEGGAPNDPGGGGSGGSTGGSPGNGGRGNPPDASVPGELDSGADSSINPPDASSGGRTGTADARTPERDATSDEGSVDPCVRRSWSRAFGPLIDSRAVAEDARGNVVVAGGIGQGSVQLDDVVLSAPAAISGAPFVVMLDDCGHVVWGRDAPGEGQSGGLAEAVAVGPDDSVVATGYFSGSVDFGAGAVAAPSGAVNGFVVKYDKDGRLLWVTPFDVSSGTEVPISVAVDRSGNVLIAGSVASGAGIGTSEGFIEKFDANGAPVWSRAVAGSPIQTLSAFGEVDGIAVDSLGDTWSFGRFDGATLHVGGASFPAVRSTLDPNAYAAKLDSDGNVVTALFRDNDIEPNSMAPAPDGGFYLLGRAAEGLNLGGGPAPAPVGGRNALFVARFSPTGSFVWNKYFSTALSGIPFGGLAIDTAGNIAIMGESAPGSTLNFGGSDLTNDGTDADLILARFDPQGAHLYSDHFGEFVNARAIAFARDGFGLAVGQFNGAIDFGQGALDPSTHMFVAKLALSQ